MSHWAVIRNAILEAEKERGRYLTLPEVEKIHEQASWGQLAPQEIEALKRIWPGMKLTFNLGDNRGQ